MNKIINFLQRVKLARIVLVFLAGAVLFVSTACSSNPTTMAKRTNSNYPDQPSARDNGLMSGGDTQRTRRENPPSYRLDRNMKRHMKESYTPQSPKAGMNQGLDVDIRQKDNLSAAQRKAERLVTQAEQNTGKVFQVDKGVTPTENLQRRATPEAAKEKIEQITGNVSDSAGEMGKGARRGFENLKENVGSAIEDATR